jgi:shikimate kinase
MSHRNVVLIGMMGAGKTQVGEQLADQLGYDFVDTDARIVARAGKSIAEIFAQDGEEGFRKLEHEELLGLEGLRSSVVSVGGGAPMREANRVLIGGLGTTIYLRASAGELYARVKNDRKRPLMQVEDPRKRVAELLAERDPVYRKADFTVDTEMLTVPEVVDFIIDELAKRTVETHSES